VLIKQDLDAWLNDVNYRVLNSKEYIPSEFALVFMNFIKLVNGAEGESNKTPPLHLKMLDKAITPSAYVANLCFRGAAKTTLWMEYFTLFLALYGFLPNFGKVEGMIYISDSMENGVKSARKNIEFRYHNSSFLKEWIPEAHFTDPYMEFCNKEGHRLGVKMFGAKTGLRGTKIFGKRPVVAVLDDLVSDDDAKSKVSMIAIKDTVYKGVNHALDPTRRKVIFNGTPFAKDDILVEAVESGAWDVNVWPVCERFPCKPEEFSGAWEDRFSFDYIKAQYDMAVATGHLAAFDQELMLRLTSEEDRLIQENDIRWYSRAQLLEQRNVFNFYITTDIASSKKQTADYSVISVWAYNAAGQWYWVDGICSKQTIDRTWDDLFRLVSEYHPQQVGVEVNGQQQVYITWLQKEMMDRNIWFSFAPSKNGEPGLRVEQDKLSRLNVVVPWFKVGRVYFPAEMKHSVIIGEFMQELRLATRNGLKGKDDCLDTISMLGYLNPWKPSESAPLGTSSEEHGPWAADTTEVEHSPLSSYVV
jgi:predicted phage terminase large subunit-like protein